MLKKMLFSTIVVTTIYPHASAGEVVGPAHGYLIIHGGGESPEPLDEFIRLAGRTQAKVVLIPTAAGFADYGEQFQREYFHGFQEKGVTDIRLLHTMDRQVADSDTFVAPLATTTGVWFLAGIVVHGDEFRVIGSGYVAIYDPKLVAANGHFYFLKKGERFQLSTCTPMSEKGEPLWLPNILPAANLTRLQLNDIAGTYLAGEQRIRVTVAGKRVKGTLCTGDERELVPISC